MCPLCQVKFVLILKLRNTAPPALQLSFQFSVCVYTHYFQHNTWLRAQIMMLLYFDIAFFLDKEILGFE